jgi:electron transfer flavoprotein beta subunit
MKAIVLLSAGIHPRSGAPMPVPVELQAIALAHRFGCHVTGLHAGPSSAVVADCLGHGLARIIHLRIAADDDPLAALRAEIADQAPDLVLAARRGQGGADSGLLPYRLAKACGMPIAADAVALEAGGVVVQALPRGAKRRLVLRLPAVLTVHDSAPPPLPFVYRQRLAGEIFEKPGISAPAPAFAYEDRPYRRRPKLIGDSSAQRSAGGRLMVHPTQEEAAAAILDYLRKLNIR